MYYSYDGDHRDYLCHVEVKIDHQNNCLKKVGLTRPFVHWPLLKLDEKSSGRDEKSFWRDNYFTSSWRDSNRVMTRYKDFWRDMISSGRDKRHDVMKSPLRREKVVRAIWNSVGYAPIVFKLFMGQTWFIARSLCHTLPYRRREPGCSFCINTLRPRRNEQHFADDIFKRIFFNENVRISIKISMKFVPKGPINNNPALVQIMAWRRLGDKPLSEAMMVR